MASDGTGVRWPHIFIQANNESVVQTANTVRQYVEQEDHYSSIKISDITVCGFNVGLCKYTQCGLFLREAGKLTVETELLTY